MPVLLVMIFIMPFENSPYLSFGTSFLGIIPDFTAIKLIGLLGFLWATLRIAAGERVPGLGSPQAKVFAVFFVGVVAAGILSGSGFVAVARYLSFLTFLPFVLVAVRTEADLRKVVYALVLSYTLVFPYAVRQMVRFDSRLGTGLYESNYFAAILLLLIPLALVLVRQQRERTHKVYWLGAAVILVTSVLLASSRGALLGLIVAGMLFAYRHKGMLGVLGLVVVIVLGLAVLPTDLGERALATLQGEDTSVSLAGSNRAHTALFWAALHMIADAPVTGVGPRNFLEFSRRYSGLDQAYIGHNTYLEIAAELGLPLLAVFLALLSVSFIALGRAARAREHGELAGWAEGFRYGLMGFCVAGTFISAQYEKLFWIVIFLSIVMERLARVPLPEAEPAEEGMTVVG